MSGRRLRYSFCVFAAGVEALGRVWGSLVHILEMILWSMELLSLSCLESVGRRPLTFRSRCTWCSFSRTCLRRLFIPSRSECLKFQVSLGGGQLYNRLTCPYKAAQRLGQRLRPDPLCELLRSSSYNQGISDCLP